MDDDVECIQSPVKNLRIPRIDLKAAGLIYEDKQRNRRLVPVAVNQLKIFSLPKENGSSTGK